MKNSLLLLFAAIIFLGFASPVLAGCGAGPDCGAGQLCAITLNPPSCTNNICGGVTGGCDIFGPSYTCNEASKTCVTNTGFSINLPNPLCLNGGANNTPCINDFPSLIAKISSYIIGVIGSLAVIMIIWAGILFVTAGANPSNVEKAKKVLMYAVIGIAISLAGAGLVAVIKAVLGVP